jgi:hypothetical protein
VQQSFYDTWRAAIRVRDQRQSGLERDAGVVTKGGRIDRLVHHATIREMNVESYRRKAALKRKRGKGD